MIRSDEKFFCIEGLKDGKWGTLYHYTNEKTANIVLVDIKKRQSVAFVADKLDQYEDFRLRLPL